MYIQEGSHAASNGAWKIIVASSFHIDLLNVQFSTKLTKLSKFGVTLKTSGIAAASVLAPLLELSKYSCDSKLFFVQPGHFIICYAPTTKNAET